MVEYAARLKHKRDTSANWTAKDPVLLNGEIIFVDTSAGDIRVKVGDGTRKYSELPFLDEAIYSKITDATSDKVKKTELAAVATSGKASDLDNDAGFLTLSSLGYQLIRNADNSLSLRWGE